jgi:hypothetical protein
MQEIKTYTLLVSAAQVRTLQAVVSRLIESIQIMGGSPCEGTSGLCDRLHTLLLDVHADDDAQCRP